VTDPGPKPAPDPAGVGRAALASAFSPFSAALLLIAGRAAAHVKTDLLTFAARGLLLAVLLQMEADGHGTTPPAAEMTDADLDELLTGLASPGIAAEFAGLLRWL
jgi:hypothetical protein